MRPMTKSPDITSLEKPRDDVAGGCVPSSPCDRIMRVVAMLSDSRSMVAISRTVGKEEKSSGRWIHSATIRISTESAIEKARPMSIRKAGIGRNRTGRMMTMPSAKTTSRPRFRLGSSNWSRSWPCAAGSQAKRAAGRVETSGRSLREARPRQLGSLRTRSGCAGRPTLEKEDICAPTKGPVTRDHDQDGDDLGDEGQRDFLHLVSAWTSAMPTPTTIATSTAGPEAISTVQIAYWTISRASASFMSAVSLYRHAAPIVDLLAVLEHGHQPARW